MALNGNALYVPSKRRGHPGIRRLAKCKKSYRCENPHYDFMTDSTNKVITDMFKKNPNLKPV